jgi:hypothetical protein
LKFAYRTPSEDVDEAASSPTKKLKKNNSKQKKIVSDFSLTIL